jgi:hypothetical protein
LLSSAPALAARSGRSNNTAPVAINEACGEKPGSGASFTTQPSSPSPTIGKRPAKLVTEARKSTIRSSLRQYSGEKSSPRARAASPAISRKSSTNVWYENACSRLPPSGAF